MFYFEMDCAICQPQPVMINHAKIFVGAGNESQQTHYTANCKENTPLFASNATQSK